MQPLKWAQQCTSLVQTKLMIVKHQILRFGRKKWKKRSWQLKILWWWTNVHCILAVCTILVLTNFLSSIIAKMRWFNFCDIGETLCFLFYVDKWKMEQESLISLISIHSIVNVQCWLSRLDSQHLQWVCRYILETHKIKLN